MLSLQDFKIYNQMIEQLYRVTDLNQARSEVLEHLQKIIPFDSAGFFLVNPESSDFMEPLLFGLDRKWFDQYQLYYEEKDEYKKAVFSIPSIPSTDRSSDYMDYKEWSRNEHRADFLLAQDIYHIACMQVFQEGKVVGEISLHRKPGAADFNDHDMLILEMLHTHINRVFSYFVPYYAQFASTSLDIDDPYCKMPVFWFDYNYNLVGANPCGQMFLSRNSLSREDICRYLQDLCRSNDDEHPGRLEGNLHTPSSSTKFIALVAPEPPLHNHKNIQSLGLSRRETDILLLTAKGKTNKEIARELLISENTVKTYIKRLFSKCNVSNRTELVRILYNR